MLSASRRAAFQGDVPLRAQDDEDDFDEDEEDEEDEDPETDDREEEPETWQVTACTCEVGTLDFARPKSL